MKNKIGFTHMPRTGGTYLESIISESMGPDEFINFFGTPNEQKLNKISIIENISKDKKKQKDILNLTNWNKCILFSGHFSLNIKKFLPPQYNYKFITIIRNPLDRVISFVKKITSSRAFKQYITGDKQIDDSVFWNNYMDYVGKQKAIGLMPHERNGFNNYYTKVLAGEDLSNPFLFADTDMLDRAISNMDNFLYVGLFEKYTETLHDICNILSIPCNMYEKKRNNHIIPDKAKEFITKNNYYDIELYRYIQEKYYEK